MNAKLQNLPKDWIDPDDAPELTDEFFEKGVWRVGDKVVSREDANVEAGKRRGRPAGTGIKVSTTIRFDVNVLEAFKATGDGWQTRMNDALKDWLVQQVGPAYDVIKTDPTRSVSVEKVRARLALEHSKATKKS